MAELTREALERIMEKFTPAPKRPEMFVMNWKTWCASRRALKELGIPVRYVRIDRHRWRRYVEGVIIHVTEYVDGEHIYVIDEFPRPPLLLTSMEKRMNEVQS